MLKYICPECGREINDEFCVSIGGLFLSDEAEEINPFAVYAFLHDGVNVNDSIAEYKEFELIRDFILAYTKLTKENPNIKNSDLRNKIVGENDTLKEYYKILEDADTDYIRTVLGYDINYLEDPAGVACIQYIWAYIVAKAIKEALNNDNRIVRYMLSVHLDDSLSSDNFDWCKIDLKECFTEENLGKIVKALTFLYDPEKRADDSKEAHKLIRLISTSDNCILNFLDEWCIPTIEKGTDGKKYLVNFQYGRNRGYIRICPICGAHIVSRLGMYEQRIISFIGMPTSGKSTLINAIYSTLNRNNNSFTEINCHFDMNDPMYNDYEKNSNNAEIYGLSTEKTSKGQYPSLSVCLECESKKYIYSFVDVPGEYFTIVNTNTEDEVDMFHLNVMAHSDILCVVVAGEQILRNNCQNVDRSRMATTSEEELNSFIRRLNDFKANILRGDHDIPVFLIVTKPDAIEPSEESYGSVDGERIWLPSNNTYLFDNESNKRLVRQEEIDKLYRMLRENNIFFKNSFTINFNYLLELQRLAHLFILGEENSHRFIEKIFNSLCGRDISSAFPIFMVSSFGYYAANNAWNITNSEKREAIENQKMFDAINEEEYSILINAKPAEFNEDYDKITITNESKPLDKIQKELKLSKAKLEEIYLDYYRTRHRKETSFGISAMLAWFFIYTNLINYSFEIGDRFNDADDKILFKELLEKFRPKLRIYESKEKWIDRIVNEKRRHNLKNDIYKISDEIRKCESNLSNLDMHYAELKFYEFRKKKEIKSNIKNMKDKITELKSKKANMDQEYNSIPIEA